MPPVRQLIAHPEPSLRHAHERLCEVEQDLDLLRYTIDGWAAWPLLRFEVSVAMAGLTFSHRSVVNHVTRLRQAVRDVPRLAHVDPARHVIQTFSSGLIERDGNRYRDMWFDDDVVRAAGSTFKIETLNNPRFEQRSDAAGIPRHLWSSAIEVSAAILRHVQPSRDVGPVATAFSRALGGPLNLPQFDERWVARRLQRFSAMRKTYGALMRRIRPLYVLVVNASHHGLMAAAKEQGAIVLEQQHGITDRSNTSYSWPASVSSYRRSMPIPDRLLLYGQYWKNELATTGFWGDDLRVVGSPRLDRCRDQNNRRDDPRCTIVFTTQGLEPVRVIAFFRQFVERMDRSRVPYRLAIKLHPIYDADKAPYLEAFQGCGDRVDVIAGDEVPSTLDLLRAAHLHVSIASASHYEAVSLGVPTVILPFNTHEVVLPLHRAGHAWLARTPDDLVSLVAERQALQLPREAREHYFRPGATANILRELGLESAPDVAGMRPRLVATANVR
jgi:hypothetical protein